MIHHTLKKRVCKPNETHRDHCICASTYSSYCHSRTTFSSFDLNLKYWRVFAGEHNISSTDPNEKVYHIRRVVVHPGFNATSLENDVAIVILSDFIKYVLLNSVMKPGVIIANLY